MVIYGCAIQNNRIAGDPANTGRCSIALENVSVNSTVNDPRRCPADPENKIKAPPDVLRGATSYPDQNQEQS